MIKEEAQGCGMAALLGVVLAVASFGLFELLVYIEWVPG